MNQYDRWKTTPPWDTYEIARYNDAFMDAGWRDKHLEPRIDEMLKVGKFMKWLENGIYEDDPCIDQYDWLVEGVALELDILESDICEDWQYRARCENLPSDWIEIDAIAQMRLKTSDDVLEYLKE